MRLVSSVLLLLAATTASAAETENLFKDLPMLGRPGDFSLEAPEVDETESASGFYFRTMLGKSGVKGRISGAARGTADEPTSRLMGIGAGYQFSPWLRGDITVDHANDVSIQRPIGKARFSANSLMANVYWDMFTIGRLTPYVGAGAGFGFTRFNFEPLRGAAAWGQTDINFAWNATAGVGWAISDNWTLDVSYRYAALGQPSFSLMGQPFTVEDAVSHQVRVGVRYSFH
ncbi:HEAT resistant agglutinin 1 protein [Azorhizobium oxalatiphilum]|uniref:HEAT resistant agglutinin 1 protein n=1 Tax=Azorhizobium oxalatiphilum TaxID=980631 RepID=A0A917CFJ6_9HYPH|nr:outer membrane beta-barrel protein [Azorhizobium oxalatiphilum]GGF86379.1 HEAT resistant agglutinin 1 protein [Azorhizobium oxalatiphilum]